MAFHAASRLCYIKSPDLGNLWVKEEFCAGYGATIARYSQLFALGGAIVDDWVHTSTPFDIAGTSIRMLSVKYYAGSWIKDQGNMTGAGKVFCVKPL